MNVDSPSMILTMLSLEIKNLKAVDRSNNRISLILSTAIKNIRMMLSTLF